MKRAKGLIAILMVLALMLGNMGVVAAAGDSIEKDTTGGYTTLEDPDPIKV